MCGSAGASDGDGGGVGGISFIAVAIPIIITAANTMIVTVRAIISSIITTRITVFRTRDGIVGGTSGITTTTITRSIIDVKFCFFRRQNSY